MVNLGIEPGRLDLNADMLTTTPTSLQKAMRKFGTVFECHHQNAQHLQVFCHFNAVFWPF